MSKPSTLPRWATALADPGDIVEPLAGKKDIGWQDSEKPPHSYMNWLFNLIYLWTAYLNGLTDEALTWTAAHIFQKGITVTNSTTNGHGTVSTGNGTGHGVRGISGGNAASRGVKAESATAGGTALEATATGASSTGADVTGTAYGVKGSARTAGASVGVHGEIENEPSGYGVYGEATAGATGTGANGVGGHGGRSSVTTGGGQGGWFFGGSSQGIATALGAGAGAIGQGGHNTGTVANSGNAGSGLAGFGGESHSADGASGHGVEGNGGRVYGGTNTSGAAGVGGKFTGGNITSDVNGRKGGAGIVVEGGTGQAGTGPSIQVTDGDIVMLSGSIVQSIGGGNVLAGLQVDGNLQTIGTSDLIGDVTAHGKLDVTGIVTLAALLKANGGIEIPAVTTVAGGVGFVNSWGDATGVGSATVGYWKDPMGVVHLRGAAIGGSTGTIAFTLPSGFRPAASFQAPSSDFGTSNTSGYTVNINTSGQVILTFVSGNHAPTLDGITFRTT